MNACLYCVLFPNAKVRFHRDHFQAVQHCGIKVMYRAVILRWIACCYNDPAFRKAVLAEGFILQKLQHGRKKRFRNAVDLIQK